MANKRFIDFPIATTVGDNDIILIWQGGANKQTTKATILSGVPDSLNDLTDVTISGLTNGQILRYDSVTGQWENTDQGNLDLNDLNDVTIVSPTNGQVLVYNSSTSKWENSSGGYVPYVGAVTTVDLGLQGLEAGYVRFDTSIVSVPDEQGLMYWDASKSTVALIMNGTLQHIGQDTFFYVKNSSGSSIPKGTCVRFAGTDGASGHLLITPFLANGSVPSTYFLGVTAETITNGSFGQVMHFGELEGINTSSYTAGALLYASTTVAGAFQTTAPVAPNNIVLVAAAVNSKNNGAIVVRPTYGSNINNDEGVKITSPTTGDLLQLQAGGLWENKTIDAAGIVTKATNQTITGVKTFSQDIVVNGVNVGRGGGNRTENTSTGNSALSDNTTGSGNTANGSFALFKNTSGGSNTALGTQSLTENTTGSGNTGLGWGSLYKNTSGSNNSALGNLSLYENTTGQTNVGIGFYALFKNTTGSDNTALGYTSGAYIADGSTANSISNNSVYIGAYTKALANNQTNQIVIGHNAIGGGSNTVVIGNSSILSNRFFGTMRIGTINNGVGDFITTDANGVLTKRTGAEVRTDIGAGTVTSVAALTLGTSGTDLSSTVANGTTTPVITLNVPTASATNRGALSAADWSTFNAKQNALTLTTSGTSGAATLVGATLNIPQYQAALTNPVTGTGTTNYLPKFTGSTTIGDSALFDNNVIVSITNREFRIIDNEPQIYLTKTGTDAGSWRILGSTGGTTRRFRIYDETASADRLNITSGGNVLINSTSDNGARLQVSGYGNFYSNSSTVGNANGIRVEQAGSGDSAISFLLTGVREWLFGIDNSDSDTFKINNITGSSDFNNVGLAITTAGNVGIGTASVTQLLTVNGEISAVTRFRINPSTQSNQIIGDGNAFSIGGSNNLGIRNDSGSIVFASGGATVQLQLNPSGNLLVGTTTDNGARLQVSGASTFSSTVRPNSNYAADLGTSSFRWADIFGFSLNVASSVTAGTDFIINGGGSYRWGANTYIYGNNNTQIEAVVNGNLGWFINSSGNVGIGTPSPQRRLHVLNDAVTNDLQLRLEGNAGNYFDLGRFRDTGAFHIQGNQTGANNICLAPTSGNVLIGTTTDNGATLNVNGTIRTSAPSGGTAANWKLGTATSGLYTIGGKIRIEINGVAYDILTT